MFLISKFKFIEHLSLLLQIPKNNEEGDDEEEESENESDEDIETAMKKEVKNIKETVQSKHRRFQNTDTKAKNCIFIKTTLDPNEIAHAIFTELATTKVQKTRYACRLVPIVDSCRANITDIEKLGKKVFISYFETPIGTGLGYSILFKMRNNNSVNKGEVQASLGTVIKDINPLHYINFTDPDFVVSVEVIGNVCCLGVMKDFYKFRKYNLHEVVKDETPKDDTAESTGVKVANVTESGDMKKAADVETADVDNTPKNKPDTPHELAANGGNKVIDNEDTQKNTTANTTDPTEQDSNDSDPVTISDTVAT